MKGLSTVKELQEYLQIGRAKAYELVNVPGAPIYRVGQSIRVDIEEFCKWLRKSECNEYE